MNSSPVTLKSIAKIKGGKRLPKGSSLQTYRNSHPYLRIVDMGAKNISKLNLQYVPDEVFQKISRYITNTGDILLSIVGTVGLVSIVDKELDNASLTENCVKVTLTDKNFSPEFLYYYLSSSVGQHEIKIRQVGSTQPKLPLYNIEQIPVPALPHENQIFIAKILGDLDRKIELNRRMNETLEQVGHVLFKNFFIDNPESTNWDKVRLGNIVEVTDYVANGSFASLKENVTLYDKEEYSLYIRTTDFKNGYSNNLKYVDKKSFDFLKKTVILGEEVIISNVGDVGTVFRPPIWLRKPMTLASNVVMLKPNKFSDYLFLYFSSPRGQFEISTITAGSAQPKFNKTEFRNLKITTPPDTLLTDFNRIYTSLRKKQNNNFSQTAHLTSIRNSLLPKLMSGQITV